MKIKPDHLDHLFGWAIITCSIEVAIICLITSAHALLSSLGLIDVRLSALTSWAAPIPIATIAIFMAVGTYMTLVRGKGDDDSR